MSKKHRIIIAAASALALALFLPTSTALAASPGVTQAGNLFSTSGTINATTIDDDFYWAGDSLSLTHASIGNDVVSAGRTLDLNDDSVNGSVRAAAQSISIAGTDIGKNVTVAAQDVSFSNDSSANAVMVWAQNVDFQGTANALDAACSEAVIDGTIDGDAIINADSVTIGPHANITGVLHVTCAVQPSIPSTARIGSLDFNQAETKSASQSPDVSGMTMRVLYAAAACVLLAFALNWLARRGIDGSRDMVRARPGAMLATGFVALLLAPIVFIILCVLIMTIPIAIALLLLMAFIGLAGVPFMASSLMRMSKLNRWLGAAIAGALGGAALCIPIFGAIAFFCGIAYLSGYLIQYAYASTHKDDGAPATGGASPRRRTAGAANAPEPPASMNGIERNCDERAPQPPEPKGE